MMGQPVRDDQNFGMFAQLVDMGFDCLEIEVRDDGGSCPVHSGAGAGQTREQKQAALKKKQEEAVQNDVRLQWLDAAKRGDVSLLQKLMKQVDVNTVVNEGGKCPRRDLEGKTALTLAAVGMKGGRGSGECVKLLLDRGARLDGMIIFSALQGRSEEACQLILDAGANVTNKDEAVGDYPLHTAIGKQLWGVVPGLLQRKAAVGALDASKSTALVLAVGKGHLATVQALLRAKACIDPGTVLAGLASGDEAIRGEVLGSDGLTVVDEEGRTALHLSALQKETDLAKKLIEMHMKEATPPRKGIDAPDKQGMTPLMAACRSGAMRVTCDLLRAGAGVNQRDLAGNTPLHYTYGEDKATFKTWHNTKIYQVLVAKAGADPEAVNDAGLKPKRVEEAMEDDERDQEVSEGCKQQ